MRVNLMVFACKYMPCIFFSPFAAISLLQTATVCYPDYPNSLTSQSHAALCHLLTIPFQFLSQNKVLKVY